MTGAPSLTLSNSETDALSAARAEQVRRWRAGEQPPAEEFLARHPELTTDVESAMVLVYGEVLLREELNGTLPDPAEYLARFPNFAHALTAQFDLHGALTESAHSPDLPGFQVIRELGRGGMGVVYLACDRSLNRFVAIKVLISGDFASAVARQRFRAEAEAAARLKHPHIVEVHAFGEHEGRPYLVLEHVSGGTLSKRLDGTPLDPRTAASLLLPLAGAVQHAHAAGVVHRDLKPANILLKRTEDGGQRTEGNESSACPLSTVLCPLISDFGLAKCIGDGDSPTVTSQILGTPSYMAPEQAAGARDVGPTADVYALGAILYECLTGRPPFKAATPLETLAQLTQREPPAPRSLNPAVPRDLETICLKCLSKEPAKRYATAGNLADDLSRFLDGRPVQARPVSAPGRLWLLAKRKPAISSLAAALAVLIPAALFGMTALYLRADRDRQAAERNLVKAQASFQLANDAVDKFLNAVTDNPKLNEKDFHELRKELLGSAVPFFEKFAQERSADPEQESARGKAYHRLAMVRAVLGENEAALAEYDSMRAIFVKLSADHPSTAWYRFNVAQSENNRGHLLKLLGKFEEAETAYRESLRIKEQLADEFPVDPKYRWEFARGLGALGLLWRDLGRHDEAAAVFRRVVTIQEQLLPRFAGDPARRHELAYSHNNVGITLKAQEKYGEAESAHRDAQRFFGPLVAEFPKVAAYRGSMAMSLGNLANSLDKQGKSTEAEAAQRASLTFRKQLAADFPSVPEYRQDLGMSHYNLAHLLNRVGQIEDAETVYRAAVEVRERLAADFPTAPIYGLELGHTCINLGMLLEKKGDAQASLEWFSKAIVAVDPLVKMDASFVGARQSLAKAHKWRAEVLEDLDRHGEAVKDWDRAIELADGHTKSGYQHRRSVWKEFYKSPR